jgi:hypothetical protein
MPSNYVLLERIELNASAASVTFANIPQSGYTDLKIVMSAITTGGTQNCSIAFNGSTSNFSQRQIGGEGSSAYSASRTDNLNVALANGTGYTANIAASNEIYIPNYLSSVAKSFSTESATENNATGADLVVRAHLWNPGTQAAISSVTIYAANGSGSFGAYSTFSLYGIADINTTPAIAPKASGGNIQTDGTYWYHTFLSSGTFTPALVLSCDVLQVAGGGGGQGGGGGAGGLAYTASNSLTAQGYTVTIGAGGANTVSGSNSQFGSLTAAVGGGGASSWGSVGQNGGSGGGGGSTSGTTVAGGTATSGQGFAGGSGVSNGGGGGGGAGAVGSNGNGTGGAGGVGSSTYSSWGLATSTGQNVGGTYYYAGGAGGGNNTGNTPTGGSGGGGNGSNASPTAGTANTGGGGGGAYNAAGQPGGSGIVIIRYTIA